MFAQIIKALRLKAKMNQETLAQMLDVERSTISRWENGSSTPTMTMLQKIAEVFDVSYDILLGKDISDVNSEEISVPILGSVRAGVPTEAVEDILGREYIPASMAKTGEYFALRIKGDSMSPRMLEGDIVIVKKQSDVSDGEIAVVTVGRDDATIKKISKHEDGITLIPFNEAYPAKFFTNREIINLPVEICGKVVELRGKF
ncbi:MAG: helix-turn-helix domain-containing protein [Anaerofustis stercorihominis]|nr:helix-turn-helix domain-containing protein [Anaerofustis stercorihominis]